jgi:hypothetical protein
MIGVVAAENDREVIGEFFELFKTPWEPYRPDRRYQVVLIADDDGLSQQVAAEVIVVYGGRRMAIDRDLEIDSSESLRQPILLVDGDPLPIYGDCVSLRGAGIDVLTDEQSRRAVGLVCDTERAVVIRIGYGLFEEIRILLTEGQPVAQAHVPSLDRHIELLRNLILGTGVGLAEVPPVPAGHSFIACLTHDVDHPSIRLQGLGHTTIGFLYRAVVGSVQRTLRGRMPVRHMLRNWAAAARLPLVQLGLCKDFWYEFHRYTQMEGGSESTFFVLPFKHVPGRRHGGQAPKIRASSYGVVDIADRMRGLVAAGCEVGLHGLDAWFEVESAQRERNAVANVTGVPDLGVRMHWLYFDGDSPRKLEAAGFEYDSTVGYNETVGFRAGTSQVYKLLGTREFLELPLHVMDTALFYPAHLDLDYAEAAKRVAALVDRTIELGGVLTLNWHDRSIAPERLWGEFYAGLVLDLTAKRAWCTSARRAVSWFKKRRSVQFQREGDGVRVLLPETGPTTDARAPGLLLRLHRAHAEGVSVTESPLASGGAQRVDPPRYARQPWVPHRRAARGALR